VGGDGADTADELVVGELRLVLRPARPDEGPVIATVFGAARALMTYLPVLHTPEEDVAFFSEQVLPWSVVTVAVVITPADGVAGAAGTESGIVAGFSAVKDGWLDHLYVAPPFQGRRLGGALLERAMTSNPDGLSLWVFEQNLGARAFYGRAGFVEIERTDGSANEERIPDARMAWPGRQS